MKKIRLVFLVLKKVSVNLKRMLGLAWRADRFLLLGLYGTSAIAAIFPIINSYIYKLFVDNLIDAQKIAPTIPVILLAVMGSRFILSAVWEFVQWGLSNVYFNYLFRYRLQNYLNFVFFKKVSQLDMQHYEDPKTQDLIIKAQDTMSWRPPDFLQGFSNLFSSFVSYTTSFILLVPFGVIIPIAISVFSIPRLYLRAKYGKLQWSIYGSGAPEVKKLWYYRHLLSDKTAIIEAKVFGYRKSLLSKFSAIQDELYARNKKPVVNFLKTITYPQLFEVGIVAFFSLTQLPEVVNGRISIGDFTFFLSLLDRLTSGALDMIYNFGGMYENNLYVDHLFEVMDLPKIIKDPKNPKNAGDSTQPPTIEFKNVTFKYPGSDTYALVNVSFMIKPGENVAIVGHNGAGKTTIVKLLCRLYDLEQGEILINNVNIKHLKRDDVYKFIGTLFQQFVNYNFTVEENIKLGNPNRRNSKAVKKAAHMSGATEFIDKFPKKYKQLLGREFEGGTELSYGQWQKLAIARAFYAQKPVLILDEPTSAIDADAEYEIFDNLHQQYRDKTLFLISHRFSTVRNADQIIVIDNGKIVEEGTHETLLQNNGLYARMFHRQAKGYK